MDEASKKFHEWIFSRVRKTGPKTQAGLASALGVAHPQISALKRGDRDLKVREVPTIANYLEAQPPAWEGIDFKIRDKSEIRSFLERIDGLNSDNIELLMATISSWMAKDERQGQSPFDGQSSSAIPRHESSSSRSQS